MRRNRAARLDGLNRPSDHPAPPSLDSIFPVEGAIPESLQIGRTGAIEAMAERIVHGDNVLVIEARRFGKSSAIGRGALEHVRRRFGGIVAETDLRLGSVRDEPSLAAALAASARTEVATEPTSEQRARVAAVTDRFTSEARARSGAALLDTEGRPLSPHLLSLLRDPTPPEEVVLDDVLHALELEAHAQERPVVVFIDEVQDLANPVRWKNDGAEVQFTLERALRRVGKLVSYVFAGSEKSAMKAIFAPDQPLHHVGERYQLPPIPKDAWREALPKRFAADGRRLEVELVDRILAHSGGHPQRTMQVCRATLRVARGAGEAVLTSAIIDAAHEEAAGNPAWKAREE